MCVDTKRQLFVVLSCERDGFWTWHKLTDHHRNDESLLLLPPEEGGKKIRTRWTRMHLHFPPLWARVRQQKACVCVHLERFSGHTILNHTRNTHRCNSNTTMLHTGASQLGCYTYQRQTVASKPTINTSPLDPDLWEQRNTVDDGWPCRSKQQQNITDHPNSLY